MGWLRSTRKCAVSKHPCSIRKLNIISEPSDLELSEAQIETFAGWRRPNERFNSSPEGQNAEYSETQLMIASNAIDLVQDITTDCSVVASLCAGTARAFKGHGKVDFFFLDDKITLLTALLKLFTSIIYPHDKEKHCPQVSRNGKYIFRLHFNGCFRKVIVDDRLPASNSSRSLHVVDRNNPNLLWPALIEKAYLKVRGGYDFPGSNSGTDLWVLTGWIPEQTFLQRYTPFFSKKLGNANLGG